MKHATPSIYLASDRDRIQWDRAADHPLQSWAWGEFRKAMGIDVVRLMAKGLVLSERKRVDGWLLTFHTVPMTPLTIGYFPKGPIPTAAMLAELATLARQKNAIFIQIEPNVLNSLKFKVLSLKYLHPSHHPLFPTYTFVVDLTKSEEDLLRDMHPKTRYNLKIAQKHGVVIKEDYSREAFATYLQLSRETTQRQRFYAHNETYHQRMWEILHPAGLAKLFTATYQGEVLAAWIIFSWKDTIYYPYGASSREHRDVMAPTLLLWEIARWGKRHGYQSFDLWGALGPNPDLRDPWFGFHRFKQGFGPQLVEFIGSYDLVLNPFAYRLYQIADTVRWNILR